MQKKSASLSIRYTLNTHTSADCIHLVFYCALLYSLHIPVVQSQGGVQTHCQVSSSASLRASLKKQNTV